MAIDDDNVLAELGQVFADLGNNADAAQKSFAKIGVTLDTKINNNFKKLNTSLSRSSDLIKNFNSTIKYISKQLQQVELKQPAPQPQAPPSPPPKQPAVTAPIVKTQQQPQQDKTTTAIESLVNQFNSLIDVLSNVVSGFSKFTEFLLSANQGFNLLRTSLQALNPFAKFDRQFEEYTDKFFAKIEEQLYNDKVSEYISILDEAPDEEQAAIFAKEARAEADAQKQEYRALAPDKTGFQKLFAAFKDPILIQGLVKFGAVVGIAVTAVTAFKLVLDNINKRYDRLASYLIKPFQLVYDYVTGPVSSAFSTLTGFVSKLNPSYGERASRALDDLSAVIGRILLPVFNSAIAILKVFTSTLSSNSNLFGPVIQSFTKLLSETGAQIVGNFFVLLKQATPFLEALADGLKTIVPIISKSLVTLFKKIEAQIPSFIRTIETLASLLGPYLERYINELSRQMERAAIQANNDRLAQEKLGLASFRLSEIFSILYDAIARTFLALEEFTIRLVSGPGELFGPKSPILGEKEKQFLDNLQPEKGAGEFAGINGGVDFGGAAEPNVQEGFAARGATFQSIGELGRNLSLASFGGGATPEEQGNDLLRQILGRVDNIIQNQNQFDGGRPVQGVR